VVDGVCSAGDDSMICAMENRRLRLRRLFQALNRLKHGFFTGDRQRLVRKAIRWVD
jgi:hypothetical protein